MKKETIVKYTNSDYPFTPAVLANRNMAMDQLTKNLSAVESPLKIRDALRAAKRIVAAIKAKQKVVDWTDYDADGCGCGILFTELMRKIPYENFDVMYNDRSMGFGLNRNSINMLIAKHPDVKLIITSDNGVVAFDAVDYANSLGIDVIITDHHIPDESGKLPAAYAVVDPHREDETCDFHDLCGTGVLFKVLSLVYHLLGIPTKQLNDVLDIVAVATIADVVPLRGDNRIFARIGLSKMSQECRPQWTSFKKLGSTYEPLISFTAKDVGFFVGPCINACSRMHGNISEPMHAFLEVDGEEVHESITKLTKVNEVRKMIQKARTAEAMEYVSTCNDRFILIAMDSCEEGVVGLVAGNVCNMSYRPTIVLSPDEHGNWKGSGRSIPGIHIKEVLDVINKNHPGILMAYGGHSQACGLTVKDGMVDQLRNLLIDYCNTHYDENLFKETIIVDYFLKDPELLPRLYTEKVAMEPFGCEFPEPIIMVKFKPDETRVVKDGKHLIFKYKGIDVISWNSGYHIEGKDPKTIEEVIAIGTIDNGKTLNCNHELLQIKFN